MRSRLALLIAAASLSGCSGLQSALDPAGPRAQEVSHLFWYMALASGVIFASVMALTTYSVYAKSGPDRNRQARIVIVAGALTPAVVLAVLLLFGLEMLPAAVARAPEGSLRVAVFGEQWWWRVRYEPPHTPPFETANEVRLPVGEPVEFLLHSNNVIHSFWIPSLGGKMDMIPGRVNRLTLTAQRTGRFRGVCAEYCGSAHAQMAFDVVVLSKEEFRQWMQLQREPARELQP